MITGAHILFYSNDTVADRVFFRDVLGFRAVDTGEGRLVFALLPAEAALHPVEETNLKRHAGHDLLSAVLYLMCDDLPAVIHSLQAKNVSCSPVTEERWGRKTTFRVPSSGEIGLYQPSHPTAIDRKTS